MTKEIFGQWYKEVICNCYPDIQDVAGKRLLIKSDGGPGRTNQEYLYMPRLDGCYHYPGLPNGTSLTQELDQLFHLLKGTMNKNLERIFQKKYQIRHAKAKMDVSDLPFIIFGGEMPFDDGSLLFLDNAFQMSMNSEQLDSAMKKCGYVPANRMALKSNKLRHELIMTPDGQVDSNLNGIQESSLMQSIEDQNHQVVDRLVSNGYSFAVDLKRKLRRVTRSQPSDDNEVETERFTFSGITPQQRRLLEAKTTSGGFFKATNGGAPTNSDDCLVVAELKSYEKEKKQLETKKKNTMLFRESKAASHGLLARTHNKEPRNWLNGDLRAMIRMKDPNVPSLGTLNKKELVERWEKKYSKMDDHAQDHRWTKRDERRLKYLDEGKIECIDKTGIYKRAILDRCDFLDSKLHNIPRSHALALAVEVFRTHFDCLNEAKNHLNSNFDHSKLGWMEIFESNSDESLSDDSDSYHSLNSNGLDYSSDDEAGVDGNNSDGDACLSLSDDDGEEGLSLLVRDETDSELDNRESDDNSDDDSDDELDDNSNVSDHSSDVDADVDGNNSDGDACFSLSDDNGEQELPSLVRDETDNKLDDGESDDDSDDELDDKSDNDKSDNDKFDNDLDKELGNKLDNDDLNDDDGPDDNESDFNESANENELDGKSVGELDGAELQANKVFELPYDDELTMETKKESTIQSFLEMNYRDLQVKCKENGLNAKGKHAVLAARLFTHCMEK